MSTGVSQEEERSNLRTFFRLMTAIEAGDGKLNLLLPVCDRSVERDEWIRKYEDELKQQGMRCYRVHLDARFPSLKQSLLKLQEQGGVLGTGAVVSVLGAAELLDLRLGEDRSALEKLLFSLQWTREALMAFSCPIVIWVSNKVANEIATTSPDFWGWRGNSVFEFTSNYLNGKDISVDYKTAMVEDVVILKPDVSDEQSELGIKAAAQWKELETLLKLDSDSPLLARLYQNIGFTERDRGNWDSAETVVKRAIQLYQRANNRSGVATSWGVLGDIERNRGNWDAAEQLYRQCLQIEEELGDRSGMASSWASLGYIENVRGNWDAAEQLYRQSLQLREELGDRSGMATSWGVLGDIERNRGNWDAAEQLYRQSMAISQVLGDPWLLAHNNWDLAQLYDAKNNLELAQQHYTIAHQLFTQLGARKEIEKIEREWGENFQVV